MQVRIRIQRRVKRLKTKVMLSNSVGEGPVIVNLFNSCLYIATLFRTIILSSLLSWVGISLGTVYGMMVNMLTSGIFFDMDRWHTLYFLFSEI